MRLPWRDGGDDMFNAQVLCRPCHARTPSYGAQGVSPPPFTEETKRLAMAVANYQCQCTANCPGCLK